MHVGDSLRVTLPNSLDLLPPLQALAASLAERMGFPPEERGHIELALEEAAANVIAHAFEPGERASFDLTLERIPAGLRCVIHDAGVPFDPGRAAPGASGGGLGFLLLRRFMDEVSLVNLGPGGKELRLVKYLHTKDASACAPGADLTPYPAPPAAEPAAEALPYEIRLLDPGEAVEVSIIAYRSYGYSYINPHFYFPERLVEMNRSGALVSAVAAAGDGRLMGHAALELPAAGARVAEVGAAFVKPEFRGQGVLERLTAFLLDEARRRGLGMVYVQSVTPHVYSQKAAAKMGFHDCALRLGYMSGMSFKRIDDAPAQRLSLLVAGRLQAPPHPGPLFVPPRHRAMVERLYGSMGLPLPVAGPPRAAAVPERGAMGIALHPAFNAADLEVRRVGADLAGHLRHLQRDLCLKRVDHLGLSLPLADPGAPGAVEAAEALGFFFAGLLPDPAEGDRLLLQYLNNVPIDYERIQVHSETGQALKAYVRECDPGLEPEGGTRV